MIRRKAAKALHVVGLIGFPSMALMLVAGRQLGMLLYQNEKAGGHIPMLAAITLLGFYYAVAESVLESIGLQKRCSVLTVAASLVGLLSTLLLGGVLGLGLKGYLLGELLSAGLGAALCLYWVCKKAELHIRLGNWVMRPLLASATAAALTRLLLYRLYRTPTAQILVLAFSVGVFLLLYTSFLQLLGTDFWSYTQNTLLKKGKK